VNSAVDALGGLGSNLYAGGQFTAAVRQHGQLYCRMGRQQEARELVLQQAGATLPRRDSVEARIVSDVRSGTGKIPNNEKEVGGWPSYASGEPPLSTANDGLPDEWKKAHGLSLNDPNVANARNGTDMRSWKHT
jgi:hypothetical protein